MSNLQLLFEKARKAHEENKLIDLERKNLSELSENSDDLFLNETDSDLSIDYNTECYSDELLNLIKKHKFTINSYKKNLDIDEDDYCPIYEVYNCSKNNWIFTIRHLGDCDIPEGIFSLTEVKHSTTNEKIDFYCDLGCRNTGNKLLESFLEFLEYNSLDDFVNKKYSNYLLLPNLLSKQGYTVETHDFSFSLNNAKGYLCLDNDIYVKVYKGWYDDLKLVVTNDLTWDVNSSNHTMSYDSLAYYFDYKSIEDIEELDKCIKSFKEHMYGKIGYAVDEVYFNGTHIYSYFDDLRDKKDYYKDCWNHYHISIKHNNFWDGRGYYKNPLTPNKYVGLEIYTNTILKFNDAGQWSVGDNVNISSITCIYDKRISDKCKLIIDNLVCTHYDDALYELEDDLSFDCEEPNVLHRKHPKATRLEFEGSFLEIFKILDSYVTEMCNIHEINL